MTRRIVALLLLLTGVAAGIGWWRQVASQTPTHEVAGSSSVVTTHPPLVVMPPAVVSTTTAGPLTTTTGIPPLPDEWYDRLWLTLPATATSPVRSAPVLPVGPKHDPENVWNPDFGTVEVYQDDRLAMPCEYGAVFVLGHANYSSHEEAWDVFYDVINSERYADDSGLVAGQQLVISLDDGNEVCRYELFDLLEGPGEHLVNSPGRYFLKTALSGEPDDPTGGPDDQLIQRAWVEDEPTLYLLGSYAGLSGEEMDASGVHQAYNWVVAFRLVEPSG